MKKQLVLLAFAFVMASVFAYNPPFSGENKYQIANPELLSGAGSASGGAVFTVVPGSIAFNPALTAFEQRTVLNLSYTALINGNRADESDSVYGQAFQLGTIIPTKWLVFAGFMQGTFSDIQRVDLGNSLDFRLGSSKGVTDKLYVGINFYTGFNFGTVFDYTIGADLGALYCFDDIAFLKKPRLGVSLMNLGKPLTKYSEGRGYDGTSTGCAYPGIITPRASFAATLFNVKKISGAFETELYFPSFQNVVAGLSLGFAYADIVTLSVDWEANVRELVADSTSVSWPGVGLGVKFAVNSSGISKANADWAQSEVIPALAWQNLHNGIQAISAGARLDLGMKDTTAPEIILWDEE